MSDTNDDQTFTRALFGSWHRSARTEAPEAVAATEPAIEPEPEQAFTSRLFGRAE